ncbi:MAG: cytochrome c3 family protein [Candidatus Aminicenantes bacterium]|nr:cytochrome c3 family protein [Candidatus Aminicenantes bacterium]
MSQRSAWRLGAGLVLAGMMTVAFVRAGSGPLPQADDKTCFVCHDDPELKSSAGTPIYVQPAAFAASVHGRTGRGCLGCHIDLKGVEDFPHAADLEAVACARCHADFARMTAGGVHGTASPRLSDKPVQCKDCHGYHDVLPSSDPGSPVHVSNRPATCGRCHEGAGANFARGRVHELASTELRTPPGVVRVLYKALIAAMGVFFLAYVAADLMRARRDR